MDTEDEFDENNTDFLDENGTVKIIPGCLDYIVKVLLKQQKKKIPSYAAVTTSQQLTKDNNNFKTYDIDEDYLEDENFIEYSFEEEEETEEAAEGANLTVQTDVVNDIINDLVVVETEVENEEVEEEENNINYAEENYNTELSQKIFRFVSVFKNHRFFYNFLKSYYLKKKQFNKTSFVVNNEIIYEIRNGKILCEYKFLKTQYQITEKVFIRPLPVKSWDKFKKKFDPEQSFICEYCKESFIFKDINVHLTHIKGRISKVKCPVCHVIFENTKQYNSIGSNEFYKHFIIAHCDLSNQNIQNYLMKVDGSYTPNIIRRSLNNFYNYNFQNINVDKMLSNIDLNLHNDYKNNCLNCEKYYKFEHKNFPDILPNYFIYPQLLSYFKENKFFIEQYALYKHNFFINLKDYNFYDTEFLDIYDIDFLDSQSGLDNEILFSFNYLSQISNDQGSMVGQVNELSKNKKSLKYYHAYIHYSDTRNIMEKMFEKQQAMECIIFDVTCLCYGRCFDKLIHKIITCNNLNEIEFNNLVFDAQNINLSLIHRHFIYATEGPIISFPGMSQKPINDPVHLYIALKYILSNDSTSKKSCYDPIAIKINLQKIQKKKLLKSLENKISTIFNLKGHFYHSKNISSCFIRLSYIFSFDESWLFNLTNYILINKDKFLVIKFLKYLALEHDIKSLIDFKKKVNIDHLMSFSENFNLYAHMPYFSNRVLLFYSEEVSNYFIKKYDLKGKLSFKNRVLKHMYGEYIVFYSDQRLEISLQNSINLPFSVFNSFSNLFYDKLFTTKVLQHVNDIYSLNF